MKFQKVFLQIFFLIGLIAAFMLVRGYEEPQLQMTAGRAENQAVDFQERVGRLEPDMPLDINTPPFLNPPFPSNIITCEEILEKGQEIPLETVYSNPDWKRPAYKEYWHSTVSGGRWSYMPNRIYFAMHRLFTTYMTASVYYDFVHDLGISEESNSFNYTAAKPFDKILVVAMQANVQKALTYGNQVILICKPERTGLQVFAVPVDRLKPDKPDDYILFQLTTPDGEEIDYSLISYAKWK